MSESHKFTFPKSEIWKVTLNDGYKATAQNGATSVSGNWSTIYDQAMKVELDNGLRFITNFRYNLRQEESQDPIADGADKFVNIKAGSYASFDSKCSETMVGFVQQ